MNRTKTMQEEFIQVVRSSFLSDDEKQAFLAEARKGVTDALWSHLNDRLIAVIVARRQMQEQSMETIDREVDKYTKEYEQVKTKIDYAFRDELKTIPEGDRVRREHMWTDYRKKIRKLQMQLLANVRKTSSTVLRDVVLAVVPTKRDR